MHKSKILVIMAVLFTFCKPPMLIYEIRKQGKVTDEIKFKYGTIQLVNTYSRSMNTIYIDALFQLKEDIVLRLNTNQYNIYYQGINRSTTLSQQKKPRYIFKSITNGDHYHFNAYFPKRFIEIGDTLFIDFNNCLMYNDTICNLPKLNAIVVDINGS